jgi:hypothetical protein
VQNLFTQLLDIAIVFCLYLKLQNSNRHETSWVSPQTSYLIFYQKFSTIQCIFWELWTKHWSYQNLETMLTQSTCLFCIWNSRSQIELIPVGLVSNFIAPVLEKFHNLWITIMRVALRFVGTNTIRLNLEVHVASSFRVISLL